MAIALDIISVFDHNSADKAADEAKRFFERAAEDISKPFASVFSAAFEHFDTSKAKDELKSLGDEYVKTARTAEDAQRQMVRLAEDTAAAIRRTTEVNTRYGESSSQTARALAAQHDKQTQLTLATNDAALASDAAAQAHTRLTSASAAAEGAAGGLNSGMLLAAGGAVALGAAAFEVTHKLFDMGQQWADVSDKITFATGKIGADAEAMTDRIAKIADGTDAPINTVAEVYTQLTRLKDLSGSTLDELTHQVSEYDRVAQHAGGDPLDLGNFTRLAEEFHIPAEQVGVDLDTLVKSAEDGQVPLNELIQTMETSAPTADLLGLSFAQLTNVLAALDASGVDVDKSLTGLSLGLKNVVKDAPSLQKLITFTPDENSLQRLKDVIQKIQDLAKAGDDIGAKDLGATAFGKSWGPIADDILRGKLNVDTLNTSTDAAPGKIEAMAAATRHFGDDWQKVHNQIEDALKPLSEPVFQFLDDGLKEFSTQLEEFNTEGGLKTYVDALLSGDPQQYLLNMRNHRWNTQGADSPPGGASTDDIPDGWPGHPFAPTVAPGAPGAATPGTPTAPNINTAAPYYPLDLNPADKPAGAETYDEWVSSQKQVQSAMNRVADSGTRLAEAQQRQQALLDDPAHKATQEELNSAAADLAKAQRDNQEATADLTIAQQKYTEDTNKAAKGREGEGAVYDPFKEATKNVHGLIPELASLLGAFAANEALGNPYGHLQAAKHGEDPSNPLYVSDVNGTGEGGSGGGLLGGVRRLFEGDASAQGAPGQFSPPSGGQSPAGSVPTLIGTPSGGPASASSSAQGWFGSGGSAVHQQSAALPSGASVPLTQDPNGRWTSPDAAWAHLINRESGGNPTIPNTTDSNAQHGDPSVGLFQITGATWRGAGGAEFAPGAGQATPEQQAIVAARILQKNPSGSDWGAGLPGRENAQQLLQGIQASGGSSLAEQFTGGGGQGPIFRKSPAPGSPDWTDRPGPSAPDPATTANSLAYLRSQGVDLGGGSGTGAGGIFAGPYGGSGPPAASVPHDFLGASVGAGGNLAHPPGSGPGQFSPPPAPDVSTPEQHTGTGSGFTTSLASTAISALGPAAAAAPGAAQAAQLADRTVGEVGQVAGIGAEAVLQTLFPDLPPNSFLNKILGGVGGSHKSTPSTVGQSSKDHNGAQSGSGAPPLKGEAGATHNTTSGDTVHGNQINGDVHNYGGGGGDPSGTSLSMDKYSAGQVP